MTDRERQIRRADRLRLGLILALCLLVAVPVVVAMAASPDPSASTPAAASDAPATSGDPATSTEPATSAAPAPATSAAPADPSAKPDKDTDKAGRFGNFGKDGLGRGGGMGRGAVTITKISGNDISLKTDDGWTRTITVTADTKITKSGAAATLDDLNVGDKVRFSQKKNDDGTYTITAIGIPAARAGGEVTKVDGNSVTVKGRKSDATQVITLTANTKITVGKDAGTKADITVGSRIAAAGEEDGTTFTATRVDVQLDHVGGTVTKVSGNTVTIQTRGDKTVTIHVTADTKIFVRGKDAATVADIAVGDKVIAVGRSRADGSLDAQGLGAGKGRENKPDKAPNPPTESAKPDA